jgi:hypothetical protein
MLFSIPDQMSVGGSAALGLGLHPREGNESGLQIPQMIEGNQEASLPSSWTLLPGCWSLL